MALVGEDGVGSQSGAQQRQPSAAWRATGKMKTSHPATAAAAPHAAASARIPKLIVC